MNKATALPLIAALLVAGCATPSPQGEPGDKNAAHALKETPDGFLISISYSRYQFIPESAAVMAACKQALTAAAYDVAAQRGRAIESINEQRIRLSMGRNGFTGITSCEGSAPAIWKR